MENSTLVSNAAVIDLDDASIRTGQNIVIHNGRINSISARTDGAFAQVIDAHGAFVCPGLIDGHVHLFLDSGLDPRISYLGGDDQTRWRTAVANGAMAIA